MSMAPNSKSWVPSVKDSCKILPMPTWCTGVPGKACAFSWRRTELAMTTAMMMAGDSISAMAAAMWPP